MLKRNRIEIIYDILEIVKENRNGIKMTPLLRKSNLSTKRFKDYYSEIFDKGFTKEVKLSEGKKIFITEKGISFLKRYRTITDFIEEFRL